MPTTEESLELIADLLSLYISRDTQISFNGGKVAYSIEGRSVTDAGSTAGLGQPFVWLPQGVAGADVPWGNILRCTTRAAPLALELPSGFIANVTGPVTIKDESGQASTHPITVTDADGALFDGETSMVIDQDHAALAIYPADGGWHVIWSYLG